MKLLKRIAALFILSAIAIGSLAADEKIVCEIHCKGDNGNARLISIRYNPNYKGNALAVYFLDDTNGYSSTYFQESAYKLEEDTIQKIDGYIKKFDEWTDTANKESISDISKDIGSATVAVRANEGMLETEELKFIFSVNEKGVSFLTIMLEKKNIYGLSKDKFVLSSHDVSEFARYVSMPAVKKYQEEIEQKNSVLYKFQ